MVDAGARRERHHGRCRRVTPGPTSAPAPPMTAPLYVRTCHALIALPPIGLNITAFAIGTIVSPAFTAASVGSL